MTESVLTALITGGLALLGAVYSAKKGQSRLMAEIERSSALNDARLEGRIALLSQRLDDLTREVRRHNGFAERIPALEERVKRACGRGGERSEELGVRS
ncbi:MAG: hypothetical protein IJJ23_04750 [Clostridia bacterium]|nr:hypothetical protein [Clostridia bacterium]